MLMKKTIYFLIILGCIIVLPIMVEIVSPVILSVVSVLAGLLIYHLVILISIEHSTVEDDRMLIAWFWDKHGCRIKRADTLKEKWSEFADNLPSNINLNNHKYNMLRDKLSE